MTKVWLVTGSASGLGRNIAEAVLASGDHLVATASFRQLCLVCLPHDKADCETAVPPGTVAGRV